MLERHDTLRDNIRYAREQKNLSVKRLAKLAGVGDSTIANFESRITPRMTDRIAHQIARALGVTLEDLQDPGFRLRFQATDTADRTNNAAVAADISSSEATLNDKEDDEARQIYDIARGLDEANLRSLVDYARFLATQGARPDSSNVVYRKPRRGEA